MGHSIAVRHGAKPPDPVGIARGNPLRSGRCLGLELGASRPSRLCAGREQRKLAIDDFGETEGALSPTQTSDLRIMSERSGAGFVRAMAPESARLFMARRAPQPASRRRAGFEPAAFLQASTAGRGRSSLEQEAHAEVPAIANIARRVS